MDSSSKKLMPLKKCSPLRCQKTFCCSCCNRLTWLLLWNLDIMWLWYIVNIYLRMLLPIPPEYLRIYIYLSLFDSLHSVMFQAEAGINTAIQSRFWRIHLITDTFWELSYCMPPEPKHKQVYNNTAFLKLGSPLSLVSRIVGVVVQKCLGTQAWERLL